MKPLAGATGTHGQGACTQWDPALEAVMGDTFSLSALMLMGIRSTYHLAQYSPEELRVMGSKVMTNWNIAPADHTKAMFRIQEGRNLVLRAMSCPGDAQLTIMQMAADRLAPPTGPSPKHAGETLFQVQLRVHEVKAQSIRAASVKGSEGLTLLRDIARDRRTQVLCGMDAIICLAGDNAKVLDVLRGLPEEARERWTRIFELWATGTIENHLHRFKRYCNWKTEKQRTSTTPRNELFPFKVEAIVEYFDHLEKQQVGGSTPGAFLHTCKWISERLTLPSMNWKDQVLGGFIKYYENEMSKETKKAPPMPATFFRHCEKVMMR